MLSSYYQQLKDCRRIGLFDSGVGGLTVLDKLSRLSSKPANNGYQRQHREFIYLGDTARCPYGNRKPSELVTFVREIVNWLAAKDVDGIIVACNTSASVALEATRRLCSLPIFDLIVPTAEYVAKFKRKVGVMATTATVQAQAFSRAIAQVDPSVDVVEIACPDLVPIIERGEIFQDSTVSVLQKYAEILRKEKAEVLILGCTHFPFITEPLRQLFDQDLIIVDPAQVLSGILSIEDNSNCSEATAGRKHSVYVTGDPCTFSRTANICLGYSLDTVNGITVDELTELSIDISVRLEKREATENIPVVPAL